MSWGPVSSPFHPIVMVHLVSPPLSGMWGGSWDIGSVRKDPTNGSVPLVGCETWPAYMHACHEADVGACLP